MAPASMRPLRVVARISTSSPPARGELESVRSAARLRLLFLHVLPPDALPILH
jgi:hypothetical protein